MATLVALDTAPSLYWHVKTIATRSLLHAQMAKNGADPKIFP